MSPWTVSHGNVPSSRNYHRFWDILHKCLQINMQWFSRYIWCEEYHLISWISNASCYFSPPRTITNMYYILYIIYSQLYIHKTWISIQIRKTIILPDYRVGNYYQRGDGRQPSRYVTHCYSDMEMLHSSRKHLLKTSRLEVEFLGVSPEESVSRV